MNDEERKAQLDLLKWQIEGLRHELVLVDENGEEAPGQRRKLGRKLADWEAQLNEWRRH